MITVAAFLWQSSKPRWEKRYPYTPDTAMHTLDAVRRNLATQHEVAIITDWPADAFPSWVRHIPLWSDARECGGCYTRLRAFAPDMAEIIAPRFAWIDLDAVVTADMTPLFERRENAVFWRSCTVSTLPYNGSMVLMTAGARAQVWDTFDPVESPKTTRGLDMVGTDQAWIAYTLGPDEAVWSAKDGVLAFRRDCRRGLPLHARIVYFPGATKPTDARVQLRHPWIGAYMKGQPAFDGEELRRLTPREARHLRRIAKRHDGRRRRTEATRQATETGNGGSDAAAR